MKTLTGRLSSPGSANFVMIGGLLQAPAIAFNPDLAFWMGCVLAAGVAWMYYGSATIVLGFPVEEEADDE